MPSEIRRPPGDCGCGRGHAFASAREEPNWAGLDRFEEVNNTIAYHRALVPGVGIISNGQSRAAFYDLLLSGDVGPSGRRTIRAEMPAAASEHAQPVEEVWQTDGVPEVTARLRLHLRRE